MAPEKFTKETLWIVHSFSLRIDREQHVPDSSNHSLYVIKLFSFSNLEGNFGGNQLPDRSISLSFLPPPPQPRPPRRNNTEQQHNTTKDNRQLTTSHERQPKHNEQRRATHDVTRHTHDTLTQMYDPKLVSCHTCWMKSRNCYASKLVPTSSG